MRLLRRPSHTVVVAYLALFVAATGTATAATGGSFLLGKTNAAGSTSVLKNTGFGPALQVKTRSALTAPISVSGNSTKVKDLNADEVDGYSASQLQRRLTSVDSCGPNGTINFVHSNGTVRCGLTTYFAVVKSDGTFVRGTPGAKASNPLTNQYVVGFGVDMTGCAYVASVGDTGNGSAPGFASTATRNPDTTAVFVETFNAAGAGTREPFHLVVVCPPAAP